MHDDPGGGGGGGDGSDGDVGNGGHSVCARCELRVRNLREARHYELNAADASAPPAPCRVCLGVLQRPALAAIAHAAHAQMQSLTHARSYRIAASLPLSAVLLRERAFLLRRRVHRAFSMRDALRAALKPLLMPLRYDAEAEVVFRLFYEHRHTAGEGDFLRDGGGGAAAAAGAKRARADVSITAAQKTLDAMSDKEFEVAASHLMQLPPVAHPVSVSVRVETVPLLLAARYTKLSRVVSQTPWNVASSRTVNGRVERSVQCVVERAVKPVILHERATFTAGGREDVDVRMLGEGRPFVLELQGANVVPSRVDSRMIERIVARIDDAAVVRVHGLRVVPSSYFANMKQYEAEKRKHYRCVIYTERVLDEHKLQLLNMQDVCIAQRTPLRVLHRRTQAVRHKMIFSTHVKRVMNEHFVLLDVIAQAGTYIKEFVHGDNGRTCPSVSSLLQCFADIVQLDVTEISQAS